MAKSEVLHVVTGVARLSYCFLTQPYAQNGQEPKYSAKVMLPKSDVATKQRLDAAIEAAIQDGLSQLWGGRRDNLDIIVRDGDNEQDPLYHGHWVFNARTKQRPKVVDTNMNEIIEPTEIYSGMYAYVSVDFFPYNNSGKKGVSCTLVNVMKVRDGEPLVSRKTAAEDFAQLVQQPQQGYGQQINPLTGQPM